MFKFLGKLLVVIAIAYLLIQIPFFDEQWGQLKAAFNEKVDHVTEEVDRVKDKVEETKQKVEETKDKITDVKDKVTDTVETVQEGIDKVNETVDALNGALGGGEKTDESTEEPSAEVTDPPSGEDSTGS